jgi:hypothetical protein
LPRIVFPIWRLATSFTVADPDGLTYSVRPVKAPRLPASGIPVCDGASQRDGNFTGKFSDSCINIAVLRMGLHLWVIKSLPIANIARNYVQMI